VRQFEAVPRHIPECAETLIEINGERVSGEEHWTLTEEKTRPLLLLPQAEPTEVTALIPDGPPRRFRWRGVTYDITGAQSPERIADEWWRAPYPSRGGVPTRDYYLVEDGEGHRFWLYREGLYGRETATPRWFVHGLFA
jgi:protein ImuB